MGTKTNPGHYDCYANAEPDEPMFVLLGRDADAPTLVRVWSELRQRAGDDPDHVVEALQCADAMDAWRLDNRSPAPTDDTHTPRRSPVFYESDRVFRWGDCSLCFDHGTVVGWGFKPAGICQRCALAAVEAFAKQTSCPESDAT